MQKDFDKWNAEKKKVHVASGDKPIYFREHEIWWCRLGANIGFEQDGKGKSFSRSVVLCLCSKNSINLCFGRFRFLQN